MSLIEVSKLSFSYFGDYDYIFKNVSFKIDTTWKLGFCGRNGRGKTTFLRLLMGELEYNGTIRSNVNFDYFPYKINNPTLITLDIIMQICKHSALWEIEREFSLLSLNRDCLYRSFHTLSKGEQTKALLAALFLQDNHFLLIDEPTNHLDIKGRQVVSSYLNSKKGFILVSHDRFFLDNCVDHILSINRSNIEIVKGNFSTWYANKQSQDIFEMEKNEQIKREIKRLTITAKEKADWSNRLESTKIGTHQGDRGRIGHLAAKMMKRSKAIEKRTQREIEEKRKLLKNIETTEELKIFTLPHYAQKLITFSNVSIYYGNKNICTDINFTINQGDIIALRGINGSGKSSIMKLICGKQISYAGEINIAKNLIISYVPQDTSFLTGNLYDYIASQKIDETMFKTILSKLDIPKALFNKNLCDFSEGQKKKILVAASICQKAHLYIWDEPLNYIDILSRIQIENMLKKYHPTILFAEHDQMFGESVSNKVIEL